jgi:hypothetical protein
MVTDCLKERPGDQEYLGFAVDIGTTLPPRARESVPNGRRPRH